MEGEVGLKVDEEIVKLMKNLDSSEMFKKRMADRQKRLEIGMNERVRAAENQKPKKPRYLPGTRAPSTAAEKTGNGQAKKLTPGRVWCRDRIELPDGQPGLCTICKKFSTGAGCSNLNCGGAHCCAIKVEATGERCLGLHSGVNCPHNKP